jgi:hypothetical protein
VDLLFHAHHIPGGGCFIKTDQLVKIISIGDNLNDSQNISTPKTIKPLRVLAETLILFLIANLVFALINPPPGSLLLFNRALPGFQRFPVLRVARENPNGTLTFSAEVITNMDMLFPSHIISAREKPKDEYRVILIGDSSAWGARLPLEQTLTEQINRARLKSCDDRQIVVYNLGLPGTSALKDLMIFSESVKSYHPDLFIWSFTEYNFIRAKRLINYEEPSNSQRIHAIEQSTGYKFSSDKNAPVVSSFIDRTIYGRRGELNLIVRLHWFDLKFMSTGLDDPRTLDDRDFGKKKVGEGENFWGLKSGDNLRKILDTNFFFAANKISGSIPIIYVNEPIYIEKNNPVRYNQPYPRWAYDQYREILNTISNKQSQTFVDLWDLLPSNEFSDTNFHRTFEGESKIVQVLIPVIQMEACKK